MMGGAGGGCLGLGVHGLLNISLLGCLRCCLAIMLLFSCSGVQYFSRDINVSECDTQYDIYDDI